MNQKSTAGFARGGCMRAMRFGLKPIGPTLIALAVLTACGGGGGGDTGSTTTAGGTTTGQGDGGQTTNSGGTGTSTNTGTGTSTNTGGGTQVPGNTGGTNTPPAGDAGGPITTPVGQLPGPVAASMTMACVEGGGYQCSGDSIIRVENGIGLTSSGVQVYGKSTGDFIGGANGLAAATGGIAELRIAKNHDTGVSSGPALLLDRVGISWNGRAERPRIIEIFNPTAGRTERGANGALVQIPLPDYNNLGFYDYATQGAGGTQGNYANNRYFPRANNPARCPAGRPAPCDVETPGIASQAGSWRTASAGSPDFASVQRFHEDGDVHAGNAVNGGTLPDGNGTGVPYAGSKGYRELNNWSFRYANLGLWVTQDTVDIAEWTGGQGFIEHNQIRRGLLAFGDVANPLTVPTTGTASYSGMVYGWYVPNSSGTADPTPFRGNAVATVNFATREVLVTLSNTLSDNSAMTPVPAGLTASVRMGAAGQSVANYMTGQVSNSTLSGGLSGRLFGPVAAGGSGAGPQELGGAISLTNAGGATVLGGFIARKQ
jgi:hypothetical protein